MPVIPGLRESQRLNQGGVSGFQDTSVARAEGENLQRLGRVISSVSSQLTQKRETDTFARSQWVKRSAAEAERTKNRFLSTRRDAPKDDDGSKLEEDYDRYSGDAGVNYLSTVPEEFRSESEMAFETARLVGSADVLKESEIRRKNNGIYSFSKTTDELVNSVNADPENAKKYLTSGMDNIIVATDSGVLPADKFNDNITGFSKKIAEARVDGYLKLPVNSIDIPIYDKAREALEESKDLFTPEEYEKKSKGIEAAKYTGITRIIKNETDSAENRKKAVTAQQEAEIDNAFQQMMEFSNDPVKVVALKQNMIDRFKEGRYKYAAPKFFKAFSQAENMQDAAISYEIIRELGNKPTNRMINDMRDRVIYSVADDRISSAKGQDLLDRLKLIKAGNSKDPNYTVKVRSVMDYIKLVHNTSDLETMIDIDGEQKKSALNAVYKANTLLGRGLGPDDVLNVLKKQFGETKTITGTYPAGYPISETTSRTLDNPKAFDEEAESIYSLKERGLINSAEYRNRMRNLKKIEDGYEATKSLKQKGLDKFINELENTPLAPQQNTQIPFRR